MITLKIHSCRGCPFVEQNEVTGFDGCSQSEEITNMYINSGNMPLYGVHELCPIKKFGSIKIELNECSQEQPQ
jgi:hypothetical protein